MVKCQVFENYAIFLQTESRKNKKKQANNKTNKMKSNKQKNNKETLKEML